MQNGPVEKYIVLHDGTTMLVTSAPRSFAGKWSTRIGCGGCLVWIVVPLVIAFLFGDSRWVSLALLGVTALVVTRELLARHSRGEVSRFLEREGGEEGWNRF